MNMGEVVSQTVYPRASKVVRMPPEGKDEASGSAWSNWDPENASMAVTYCSDHKMDVSGLPLTVCKCQLPKMTATPPIQTHVCIDAVTTSIYFFSSLSLSSSTQLLEEMGRRMLHYIHSFLPFSCSFGMYSITKGSQNKKSKKR